MGAMTSVRCRIRTARADMPGSQDAWGAEAAACGFVDNGVERAYLASLDAVLMQERAFGAGGGEDTRTSEPGSAAVESDGVSSARDSSERTALGVRTSEATSATGCLGQEYGRC